MALSRAEPTVTVATLVDRLVAIPGVQAVTLGGSRARGEERPDSGWDLGLYYRNHIDADAIRALGCRPMSSPASSL